MNINIYIQCSEKLKSNREYKVGIVVIYRIKRLINQLNTYRLKERLTRRILNVWEHNLRNGSRLNTRNRHSSHIIPQLSTVILLNEVRCNVYIVICVVYFNHPVRNMRNDDIIIVILRGKSKYRRNC